MLRSALLLFLLIPATASAQVQPPPERVDLRAVLTLARENSPRLALDRQDIVVAHAERRMAGAYPNPIVSYSQSRQPGELTNFSSNKAQEWSIELPLLIAGQRGARVEAAERGLDAARARVTLSANALGAEVGTAHVALLAAQQRHTLLTTGLEELQRLRTIVAGRHASGMASTYDLLRVDVELTAWRKQLNDAQSERADRQGQLATLLGFPGWRPHAEGELRPLPVPTDVPPFQNSPLIQAARSEEAVAQAASEVARRERFPAVSLTTGRFWTNAPYGHTNALGVSIEVPLLDNRGGAEDKARAEATSASLRRQLAEAAVQADLARYEEQVRQRRSALDQYQREVGERLPQLRQMAEDAYRLGRSPVLELLDATRSRYELQLSRIDLTAALMEAQLRLQATRGALALTSP